MVLGPPACGNVPPSFCITIFSRVKVLSADKSISPHLTIVLLTTATGPHVMSTVSIDLESGQGPEGAQAAPHAGAFFSLSHHCHLGQKCLMDHEEGVGGSDSALPVNDVQPLDEPSSSACNSIPSGASRPSASIRSGSNIEHSPRNSSYATGDQAGQRPSQTESHICAYLHDCRDIIVLTDTPITANHSTLFTLSPQHNLRLPTFTNP